MSKTPLNVDSAAEDAQSMAKSHPDTFEAPALAELNRVRIGDNVKICVGQERFWVQVDSIDGERFTGRVDNDLVLTHIHKLRCDDRVSFHRSRVYQTSG